MTDFKNDISGMVETVAEKYADYEGGNAYNLDILEKVKADILYRASGEGFRSEDGIFQNKAYMTAGFDRGIPDAIKRAIMDCIIELKDVDYDVDYLQVFNLVKVPVDGERKQKLTHTQEEPDRSDSYYINIPKDEMITEKVYVIDETEHHIFMLASDY